MSEKFKKPVVVVDVMRGEREEAKGEVKEQGVRKKEGAVKRRASREPDSEEEQKRGRDSSVSSMASDSSLSSGRRPLTIAAATYKGDPFNWEDIDAQEWEFLKRRVPLTVEAFHHNTVEEFEKRVESMTQKEWNAPVGGLLAYNESSIGEMQITAKSRVCKRCRPDVQQDAVNASFIHQKFQWASEEYIRRNVQARLDSKTAKVLTAEAVQRALEAEIRVVEMTARIEELKKEQKELRAKLRTLEEEKEKADGEEPPPVEMVEMEMGDEEASPSEDVSPALVRTVETVLERKWEQLVGQLLTQLEGQRRVSNTPGTNATWAQAVGRKERSAPPPTRSAAPPTRGKKGGVRQPPAQAKARGAPPTPQGVVSKAKAKEKGRKGKKKAWPSLPRTAAVTVNPLPGGTCSGAEFIKEAQSKLSLEELGIPPWRRNAPGWGDTSSA